MPAELHWGRVGMAQLPELMAIECRSYSHPWNQGHFEDSLRNDYRIQGLWQDNALLGYSVVMRGLDEAHLLNITVTPEHQSQGLGQALLADVEAFAAAMGLHSVWLEVRNSNAHARRLYLAAGYAQVGQRKAYYPLSATEREDAVVMCKALRQAHTQQEAAC